MSDNSKDQTEASMEEILASIRRIISQDEDKDSSDFIEAEEENKDSSDRIDDSILVLTDVVDENGSKDVSEILGKSEKNLNTGSVFVNLGDESQGPIVSSKVEELSVSLISDLVSEISSGANMGSENKTLEQLTKEMLSTMLKEWLDANLPIIVENIVREEIKRIVVKSK
jgi:cell pole-organizing protein PopZ